MGEDYTPAGDADDPVHSRAVAPNPLWGTVCQVIQSQIGMVADSH